MVRNKVSHAWLFRRQSHTCPSFDTPLNAEHKNGARLYHGLAFSVIEPTCDARDDPLTSSMNEAEGVNSSLDVASEWKYVWVTRHTWESLRLLDKEVGDCGEGKTLYIYQTLFFKNQIWDRTPSAVQVHHDFY